jgi:predicted kinase
MMWTVELPVGLVILVGAPGAGKSTLVRALVAQGKLESAAVLSADELAVELFGPDADREVRDPEIFAELDRRIRQRLRGGHLAVVEATNISHDARKRLIAHARAEQAPVSALIFGNDLDTLQVQNRAREERLPHNVVESYWAAMRELPSDADLMREGIGTVGHVPGRLQNVPATVAAAGINFVRPG